MIKDGRGFGLAKTPATVNSQHFILSPTLR